MTTVNAQTKMKALVVSRLLMGDINDWKVFEQERETANKIANRQAARSVSSQIGRSYRELSTETQKIISENFLRCDFSDLARLCDAIQPEIGLYLRLDEFERAFFPLADSVKCRFPFYAHISISFWGLQFEYPENHFLQDLGAGLDDLRETQRRLAALGVTNANMKSRRDDIAPLTSREKFISRSVISASFSLVETFLSGLFFTALNTKTLGGLNCDERFLAYAEKNERNAALKDRLDRIARFASGGARDGGSEPFKSLIEMKRYRDAIHHTTPFERKNLEAGQQLLSLYEIKSDVAVLCALLSLNSILNLSGWIYNDDHGGEIADRCRTLREKAVPLLTPQRSNLPSR